MGLPVVSKSTWMLPASEKPQDNTNTQEERDGECEREEYAGRHRRTHAHTQINTHTDTQRLHKHIYRDDTLGEVMFPPFCLPSTLPLPGIIAA